MQVRLAVGATREVVAEQTAGRDVCGRTGFRPAERTTLHEKDVEIAVVVVVEERDTRAHFLDDVVAARRAVDVCEVEARRVRRVDELGRGGRRWQAAAIASAMTQARNII